MIALVAMALAIVLAWPLDFWRFSGLMACIFLIVRTLA